MTDPVAAVTEKTLPTPNYSASQITLFGVELKEFEAWVGMVPTLISISMQVQPPKLREEYQIALLYGYAYQGHCYDLPEPIAVVVNTKGQPAKGCGYGGPGVPGAPAAAGPAVGSPFSPGNPYLMWQVDKLQRTVLMQSTNDTFEEVILKRTLIGAKQPLSYRSAAQISHRGGKLTEFE